MLSNKQYLGIITLVVVVGIFIFYWYEWRPMRIKERCSTEARFNQQAVAEFNESKRQDFINMYYEDCLMRFGLK